MAKPADRFLWIRWVGLYALAWSMAACGPSEPREAESHILRFRVVAPGLSADSSLCVAGSPSVWGPWRPNGLALHYAGNETWEGEASLNPQTLEYKFTLADWRHEALDDQGHKRPNATLALTSDVLVEDTVRGWSDASTAMRIEGRITGDLDMLGVRTGDGIAPREVWVLNPPSTANQAPIERVLVMHDGQNVVDPALSNFGVDWGADEVLDSLIRQGALPRTLLVTAACTAERSQEYGPGEVGHAYVDWLVEVLLPEVRERYGVSEEVPVWVGGASMGGLISFIAAERHPEAFAGAICMSPAFAYADFNYPEALKGRGWSGHDLPLWMDNGTVGLEEQLQPGLDDMEALLKAVGQPHVVNVYEGAKHFEPDWGARLPEALLWLESRYRPEGRN